MCTRVGGLMCPVVECKGALLFFLLAIDEGERKRTLNTLTGAACRCRSGIREVARAGRQ